MTEPSPSSAGQESRFEAISTQKSLLRRAHGESLTAASARNALVLCYRRAIRSYLGALLRNEQDADEVAHDIVMKLLQGAFAGAVPASEDAPRRGRFRDYLKRSVRNAAANFLRARGRASHADLEALQVPGDDASDPFEDQWLTECRRVVLDGALAALEDFQTQHPHNNFALLVQLLLDYPDDDSEQLAARVSGLTGRPITAVAVRKQVSRARRKFAEFLLAEVRQTLAEPTPERLEEELIEIGLLVYVREFLPPDWRTRVDVTDAD
jgi:RNA polymerase sigma-70 factor (ECF subfamily)